MKNLHRVGITLLALSMGLGGFASAQHRDHGRPDRHDRQSERRGPPEQNDRGDRADRHNGASRGDNHGQRGGQRPRTHTDGRRHNEGHNGVHSQGHHQGHHQGHYRGHHPGQHPGQHPGHYRDHYQGHNHTYNQRDEWRDPHGHWRDAGPQHNFRRGGYLPPQYRSPQYVVSDWHAHHLSPPPHGYHWVQTGGDYVLAVIASGLILQILLNH